VHQSIQVSNDLISIGRLKANDDKSGICDLSTEKNVPFERKKTGHDAIQRENRNLPKQVVAAHADG
jgi:hypothetical protein